MASSRDPRRMDPTTAEQWQRRRVQEATESKPRRRKDSKPEQPLLQDSPLLRSNPSRKSISRAHTQGYSSFVDETSSVGRPFDSEEAPKNFVPDHSPAFPGVAYERADEPPAPKKSASRRRRSTISTAIPEFERSRETEWSSPQLPSRRNAGQNQSPVLQLKSVLKSQDYRSASPNSPVDTPKYQSELNRYKPDRLQSPLPKVVFQEDIFVPLENKNLVVQGHPAEQRSIHAKNRIQTTEDSARRTHDMRSSTSPPAPQERSNTKQSSILVRRGGRDKAAVSQRNGSPQALVPEQPHANGPSLRRRPESVAAPHESWFGGVPSPPREANRILPKVSNLSPNHRNSELDSTPLTPTAEDTFNNRADRTPSHRYRQRSEYPLSPQNDLDSTPPSSGVTYYTTASDFSSDLNGLQRSQAEDQDLRRIKLKQNPPVTASIRNKNPSITPSRGMGEDRTQNRDLSSKQGAYVRERASGQSSSHLPVESSRLRDVDDRVSSPKFRSNSPALMNNAQFSRSPAASRIKEDNARYPLNISSTVDNRLRNDDSMTYVAVTASGSSPQSDLDGYEDLSEGSHYTDREALDDDDMPSWARERNSIDSAHAIKRRDALLTGLGLGTANAEGGQPAIDSNKSSRSHHSRRGQLNSEKSSPHTEWHREDVQGVIMAQYSPMEQDELHLEESRAQSTSHRSSPMVHSMTKVAVDQSTAMPLLRLENPHSSPVSGEQVPRRTRKDIWDDEFLQEKSGPQIPSRETEQISREDARRNTWVYDETKGDDLRAVRKDKAGQRFRLGKDRNDSVAIVWSDSDSPEEPLGQDAQRMFDRLQQENVTQEASYSKPPLDEPYPDSRDHTSHPHEASPSIPEERGKEIPTLEREEIWSVETSGVKTWRRTISSSAYQSLLKKHGIIEMKRQDVIFELCETEAAFVKSMKMVIRIFLDPLRSRGHWLQGLPPGPKSLFEYLDAIVDTHTQIASALHSSRASQFPLMTNFAETMRPFVYRLEVHQPYLVHLEQVTKELDGIVQDHENKFGQFIRSQSTSPECGNMGLASFLLKPMQRLTKYPLFFKQIWELTPRNHSDHLPMFSLYNSTNLVIKVMQEVKAREEEFKYIQELALRVSGLPSNFQLARRERRLIAQGLLRKVELSDAEKELLDGFNGSLEHLHESSPRTDAQRSPLPSPMPATPPIPDLAKLGPITSPLFPSYHNRTPVMGTPPSPYTPRQTYMSAVSRASTALSEASHISEWTTSYSPTTSIAIPSDFEDGTRPDSSASSILSNGHSSFVPYGQTGLSGSSQKRIAPNSLKHGGRGKTPRETPIYVFVFNDLVVFTSQSEKTSLFQSKAQQNTSEKLKLVDNAGISRILGVVDRSGKLEYEYLIQIDLLPMALQEGSGQTSIGSNQPSVVSSVYLTLPTTGNARLNLKPTEQMNEARDKWLAALDRCFGYTLRSLTFPFAASDPSEGSQSSLGSSVMGLLASGMPLPKSPSLEVGAYGNKQKDTQDGDPEWWSQKFKDILREIERIQDTPVMLIGDAALTMGRGLKRVHTTDRTRRNGPQQLLLPVATAMSSPSASSGSSQGRRSILGIKRK